METARSHQNNTGTTVSRIRSFHLGELSSYPQTLTPCISLEVPKKCFAGVSPNSSLTPSLKITLFLSGMQFVECSASVDALWHVVMFIIFCGTLPNSNQSWHWLYKYSLTSCTPLLFLFERALPSSSVSLVPQLQRTMKASAYSLEKKERGVDTLNESATPWPWQQTRQQHCFTEDALKQHVLLAKFHTLIWCKIHIQNQELIEPVGRSWSDCDDGPTMHIQPSVPVEAWDLTHLYCTYYIECVDVGKCSLVLAGLLCVGDCFCTNSVNQNIKHI